MSWSLRADQAGDVRLDRSWLTPVAGLFFLATAGTVGLMLIEGWAFSDALWMIIITMSTVGFGEVHPLSHEGRLFLMGFIVLALFVATVLVRQLARQFVEADLRQRVVTRRRLKELASMKGHHIVVGYGRLGAEIVDDLLHHGVEVVVISLQPFEIPEGAKLIVGDATDDEVLRLAQVDTASGCAIATREDAVNVYVTLSARQLAPQLTIITRMTEAAAADKARRAGANQVVVPFSISGQRMAQSLVRPSTSSFLQGVALRHVDGLHIEDVQVPENAALQGTLASLNLRKRFGITVLAVCRAGSENVQTPEPEDRIGAGDTLVVMGHREAVDAFSAGLR